MPGKGHTGGGVGWGEDLGLQDGIPELQKQIPPPSPRLCRPRPAPRRTGGGGRALSWPSAGPQPARSSRRHPEHRPHCAHSPPYLSAPPPAAGLRGAAPSGARAPKLGAGVPGAGPGTCAHSSGCCPTPSSPQTPREASGVQPRPPEAQEAWGCIECLAQHSRSTHQRPDG